MTSQNSSVELSQSLSPSLVQATTQLCEYCAHIFDHWEEFTKEEHGFAHYGTLSALAESAENGCSLCVQFNTILYRSPDGPVSSLQASTPPGYVTYEKETVGGQKGNILVLRQQIAAPEEWEEHFDRSARARVFMVPTSEPYVGTTSAHQTTQDSLQMCSEWLAKCETQHADCHHQLLGPYTENVFVPSRLVFVRGPPRLVERCSESQVRNYATLSHCWGSQRFLTLFKDNIHEFKNRIPDDALSKTFIDAIHVCRQLDVDYIWIDSLCIVQDDPDDWRVEASLMAMVYGKSFINIAASSASDGSVGLFFKRPSAWRCRVKVSSQRKLYDCVPIGFFPSIMASAPLFSRGWCVQERLLPRRNLLFTATQVFWECYGNTACEAFPRSYPWEIDDRYYAYNAGLAAKRPVVTHSWDAIVEQFTGCKLTFQRDKLIAISGIASTMQQSTGDKYAAGMWLAGFPRSLLWEDTQTTYRIPSSSPSKACCEAPSWSWASMYGRVSTRSPGSKAGQHQIEVLEISTPPSEDPFGSTSQAKLLIAGTRLLSGKVSPGTEMEWMSPLATADVIIGTTSVLHGVDLHFSQYHDIDQGFCLLPILTSFSSLQEDDEDEEEEEGIEGLIMRERPGIASGTYERIGTFTKVLEPEDNIKSPDEIDAFFEDAEAASTVAGKAPAYRETLRDNNGILKKVILLV